MTWCPLTREECRPDCAWFSQCECAFTRLHEVADKMEEVIECLESLEQTINNKDFT